VAPAAIGGAGTLPKPCQSRPAQVPKITALITRSAKGSNEFSMFPPVKLFACDMQSVVFLPVYLML
jgi:hypothetical protein